MLRNDYSWTDVALTFGATLLLAVMAVTSLGLRYVTAPIRCWMPNEFSQMHADYVHEVCFRRPVYYIPLDEAIPVEVRELSQRTYHQWVPFALGIGALICLLPHIAWRMLSGPLILDTHALLSSMAENQRQSPDRRHVLIRDTAILIQAVLKRGNTVLTVAALFRKLLAIATCLTQLLLVVGLFRPRLSANEIEDVFSWTGGIPLPDYSFLCDVRIRQLQTVQMWTVQCVLPLNQVYSKGFTFLFYVFLLLAVLCTLDLLLWSLRLLVPGLRDVAVKRQLGAVTGGEGDGSVSQLYPRFSQWLAWDGRLLLALTADYCGPLAATDLTSHLWTIFKATPVAMGPGPASHPYSLPGNVGAFTQPATEPSTTTPLVQGQMETGGL